MWCCISLSGGKCREWTDGNMQCKPETGIFPPVGGAVDVGMCSAGGRGERREITTEIFETKSERIRRRKGYGGEREGYKEENVPLDHPPSATTPLCSHTCSFSSHLSPMHRLHL